MSQGAAREAAGGAAAAGAAERASGALPAAAGDKGVEEEQRWTDRYGSCPSIMR